MSTILDAVQHRNAKFSINLSKCRSLMISFNKILSKKCVLDITLK